MNAAAKKLLQWLVRLAIEHRRRRHDSDEQRLLDASALRDLGVDRSELDSCRAEATGAANCTRRRVADAKDDLNSEDVMLKSEIV